MRLFQQIRPILILILKAATAIDLAGRNVLEAVQMSVNPKVINTPAVFSGGKRRHSADLQSTRNCQGNIRQLVGGAGEENSTGTCW